MKIVFLGTSDGLPRKGHHPSATVVEVGSTYYLVDAGAPVMDLLLEYGYDPNKLGGFFNTPCHGDHFDGLLYMLTLAESYYRGCSCDFFLAEQGIADAMVALVEAERRGPFPYDRLRVKSFSEGVIFDDGNLRVTAIPTKHCSPKPSYAFLLEGDGKRVLMTGDLSQFLKKQDFPEIAFNEELDLIVCEMAHFGAKELLPTLAKCKTKQLAFNHYQLEKESEIRRVSLCGGLSYPAFAAEDGMILQLT